ncbi:ELM1/GtrOC1 family putative glycosyltransferase [Microbulbifer sp. HZ11]|uniref:ELM1/GtrOC1 family putative glycosyltransferase n=1 Tax=Microbulbifer sp. HZ11 TaxID=1453501 RepID=UPI00350EAC6B
MSELVGSDGVQSCDVSCEQLHQWRPGALRRALEVAGATELGLPNFIIGAGHRCHLPMIAARRSFGGRSVVLMKPSLPVSLFDFAVIPEHDRPPPLPNVLTTLGALTGPLPKAPAQPNTGLILLGGPSRHFAWDCVALERDINQLAASSVRWTLADSRRSPDSSLLRLAQPEFNVVSWSECEPGWLEQQLASVEQVWVTRDSISMVFEALQSGAQVGILNLPSRHRKNKVYSAVQRLVDLGLVTTSLDDAAKSPVIRREPLNQYRQIASALLRRCNLDFSQ